MYQALGDILTKHCIVNSTDTSYHERRHCIVNSWQRTFDLKLHLPRRVLAPRPGKWSEESFFGAPLTRFPLGEQDGFLSILDYAFENGTHIEDSWVDWEGAMSDHALLGFCLRP